MKLCLYFALYMSDKVSGVNQILELEQDIKVHLKLKASYIGID